MLSTDGNTDLGTATTTTVGTDGGWRDSAGNPVSEMGHMYYVTLGNLGICDPTLTWCTSQSGSGLTNAGPFSNLGDFALPYWSGTELDSVSAWTLDFMGGVQAFDVKGVDDFYIAWAVHSGDVTIVPLPAATWLFGSGLIFLIGVTRSKEV